jgi:hypothetical protein
MINNFVGAFDEPIGICLQNEGYSDCSKWPDRYPSPCCWLSCSELCGAACLRLDNSYGEKCKYYGGEYCASTSIS